MGEASTNGWRGMPRGVIDQRIREWAKTGRIEVIEKPDGLWWRIRLDTDVESVAAIPASP